MSQTGEGPERSAPDMDMKRLEDLGEAPDFSLADTGGHQVRLSDYRGRRPVVLVFNRGFT